MAFRPELLAIFILITITAIPLTHSKSWNYKPVRVADQVCRNPDTIDLEGAKSGEKRKDSAGQTESSASKRRKLAEDSESQKSYITVDGGAQLPLEFPPSNTPPSSASPPLSSSFQSGSSLVGSDCGDGFTIAPKLMPVMRCFQHAVPQENVRELQQLLCENSSVVLKEIRALQNQVADQTVKIQRLEADQQKSKEASGLYARVKKLKYDLVKSVDNGKADLEKCKKRCEAATEELANLKSLIENTVYEVAKQVMAFISEPEERHPGLDFSWADDVGVEI